MNALKYNYGSKSLIMLLMLSIIHCVDAQQKNAEWIHGFICDDKNNVSGTTIILYYPLDRIYIGYILTMDNESYYFYPKKGEHFIVVLCEGCTHTEVKHLPLTEKNVTMPVFLFKKKEESLYDSIKDWWSGWGGFIGFLSAIIIFLVGRWLEKRFRKKKIVSTIIIPLCVPVSQALSGLKELKNKINEISYDQINIKIDELKEWSETLKKQIERSLMANELVAYLSKDEIDGLIKAQLDVSEFLNISKDKGTTIKAISDYVNGQYNPQKHVIENFDNSLETLSKYIKEYDKKYAKKGGFCVSVKNSKI